MLNIVLVLRRVDGVQAKPDLAARQTVPRTRPKTISARPWQYSLTPQKRGGEFSGRITRILWTLSECKSVRKCGSRTSTRPRPSL